jgi:subtilisin-like proprotein convertase family protein
MQQRNQEKFRQNFVKPSKMLAMIAALIFLTAVSNEGQTTFSNSTPITINDGKISPTKADPYPSTINVSNLSGTITKVTVTLNSLSHTYLSDVDIMLVSPTGAKLVLFSDIGEETNVESLTVTLDDEASSLVPEGSGITSGKYKPTDRGEEIMPEFAGGVQGDMFPDAPTPALPTDYAAPFGSGTLSGQFNGANPNGEWKLYVVDDIGGDSGSISGGWSLSITTTSATAASVSVAGRVLTSRGRGLMNAFVRMTDASGVVKTARTNPLGFYRFEDVSAGGVYAFTVSAKRYTFSQPTRVQHILEETDEINFIADN